MKGTLDAVEQSAAAKAANLQAAPHGYLILSALAGVYVGFAIVLVFAIGAPLAAAGSPWTKTVMGASFGAALSLVIVAGSELFTGNVMVMSVGLLRRAVSPAAVARIWLASYGGNLAGSLLLALLVAQSGVLGSAPQSGFVQSVAETKMNLPATDLFWRAVLCNWLVCLAVWCAFRTTSEAGRLIMVFWCLFAFFGAGFEHSVANMTLLGVALVMDHPETVTWGGFVHNLVPVTLGNVVSGVVFVAGAYWMTDTRIRLPFAAGQPEPSATPVREG
ncbi:MAG TPA: formate/nitrite transporter family protein [Tepidiformaceae bacterium]|jgi:nitrite transporter NirC|nr:formate/nitrite transporter family protein [Tepidiformaceae bacterium]